MPIRSILLAILAITAMALPNGLDAQKATPTTTRGNAEVYAGYSYLSDSFNSYSNFSGSGLNGWEVSGATSGVLRHHLKLKAEAFGLYGSSLDATLQAHFFMAGLQYGRHIAGRESVFVHGLIGMGHLNPEAIRLGGQGAKSDFSFAEEIGGGLDTAISRRVGWRFQVDMLNTHFAAQSDQIQGLANTFARISTGPVLHF